MGLERNYHANKFFTEILLAIAMNKKMEIMIVIKKNEKTDNISKDIAEDAETRFDTSNYELDRPLPEGRNKKVIGLM